MHGGRQIGKKEGEEVVGVSVCVCGLNRMSHHPRSTSPSCPQPLGSLGTWGGVCFTASWSGSEWMMRWKRQAEYRV